MTLLASDIVAVVREGGADNGSELKEVKDRGVGLTGNFGDVGGNVSSGDSNRNGRAGISLQELGKMG